MIVVLRSQAVYVDNPNEAPVGLVLRLATFGQYRDQHGQHLLSRIAQDGPQGSGIAYRPDDTTKAMLEEDGLTLCQGCGRVRFLIGVPVPDSSTQACTSRCADRLSDTHA